MSIKTNAEHLKFLRSLRLSERKPGWDQCVRSAAITALVDFHYGTIMDKDFSPTDAFLEIVIEHLENPPTETT